MRYLSPKDREVPVYVPSAIIGAPEIEGELAKRLLSSKRLSKALSLAAAGLQTTGLGGVATTLDKHTRLNRSWDWFDLLRTALSSCASTPTCAASPRWHKPKLASCKLSSSRGHVSASRLPRGPRDKEEWGPDDFIAANGADALLKVLAGAALGDPPNAWPRCSRSSKPSTFSTTVPSSRSSSNADHAFRPGATRKS